MNGDAVSLVIPGRNCADTIRQCLSAVTPLLDGPDLREILFVDDGSTDGTAQIVAEFPVTCLPGVGQGAGSARNIGWRAAQHPFVWFVDADCVAESDALDRLMQMFADAELGGASGSYGIMNAHSLLACLIHEEIIERHRTMADRVDFLATFNVVYRREALETVGGFDERYLKAQDAELAFRVKGAGYALGFVFDSRVKHFHPTRWLSYLRTQRKQGYWRVWLHMSHRGHATGDSYSSLLDHMQPPLAMLTLASLPLCAFGRWAWVPVGLAACLALAQLPLTARLIIRLRRLRYVGFAWMSFIRSFWRGVGMTHGLVDYILKRGR